MSTEISSFAVPTFIECVSSTDSTEMENICASMYHLILEALSNGTEKAAKEQLHSFYEVSDRLVEYLELTGREDGDTPAKAGAVSGEKLKSYYLGQMVAAAGVLSDVERIARERDASRSVTKRHKHLKDCLTIVAASPGIPGTELKKQLELSDSAFSNFMKRVESQRLFYVQKDGNTNYYTLSPRGRRFLQNSEREDGGGKRLYDEKFLLLLLDVIASETLENRPNASRVVLQVNHRRGNGVLLGNTQLLKKYIQQIFDSFEQNVEKKFKESVRTSISRMYKESYNAELPDWSDYSTYKPVYISERGSL